jgi:hypothetical protein
LFPGLGDPDYRPYRISALRGHREAGVRNGERLSTGTLTGDNFFCSPDYLGQYTGKKSELRLFEQVKIKRMSGGHASASDNPSLCKTEVLCGWG